MSQKGRDKYQLHTNCDDFMRESFTFIFRAKFHLIPEGVAQIVEKSVKTESKDSPPDLPA